MSDPEEVPIQKTQSMLSLEFNSVKQAYEWYNNYAKSVGFSIRNQYTNKSKLTGEITSRRFVCYKEGVRKADKRDKQIKKRRKEIRTGCDAHMTISLKSNNTYQVIDFVEKHNHDFVDSSCSYMLPSQRKISEAQAYEATLAMDSGIRPKLAIEMMRRQAGGRESLGFILQDDKNMLRTKRKNDLRHGEVGSLLNYFNNKLLENPSFFFALQTDVEDEITNIFWADARMLLDYNYFGDMVSFDTTYRTNKESRPFGAFIGLNNHYQQVIFGACLMYDETADSFQWLFDTFLKCMAHKNPQLIFTDQDAAMKKALSLSMPHTFHKLCLWHIRQNAMKHLGYLYKRGGSFARDFNACIYSEDEEEFLLSWKEMLDIYELQDNSWLKGLLELKEKWAMAYGREYFSAGKESTQLSESFNARLKDYLKSDLDLLQFFHHFERAVDDLRENEKVSKYDASQKLPQLKLNIPLLRHARDVYTEKIFEMFQEEFEKSLLVSIEHKNWTDNIGNFKVSVYGCSKQYAITVNSVEGKTGCSCQKFESSGIPCSHIMKVLDEMKIKSMIPDKLIIKRWTKNARAGEILTVSGNEVQEDPKLEINNRYRSLCSTYVKLAGKAAESKEAYEYLL